MSILTNIARDDTGAYHLPVAFASGIVSWLTASPIVHTMVDVFRVMFSAATAVVTLLVGVMGLVKSWCWLIDRHRSIKANARATKILTDRIESAEHERDDAEAGRVDAEARMVAMEMLQPGKHDDPGA